MGFTFFCLVGKGSKRFFRKSRFDGSIKLFWRLWLHQNLSLSSSLDFLLLVAFRKNMFRQPPNPNTPLHFPCSNVQNIGNGKFYGAISYLEYCTLKCVLNKKNPKKKKVFTDFFKKINVCFLFIQMCFDSMGKNSLIAIWPLERFFPSVQIMYNYWSLWRKKSRALPSFFVLHQSRN